MHLSAHYFLWAQWKEENTSKVDRYHFFFPFYVENWYTFWGADRKAKLYLLQVETLTILFFSLFETYIFAKNNFFSYRMNHWVFRDDEIRYIDQKINFNNFNPYKLNFFFFFIVFGLLNIQIRIFVHYYTFYLKLLIFNKLYKFTLEWFLKYIFKKFITMSTNNFTIRNI